MKLLNSVVKVVYMTNKTFRCYSSVIEAERFCSFEVRKRGSDVIADNLTFCMVSNFVWTRGCLNNSYILVADILWL